MTISFTIEYITPKEMDDLSILLFNYILEAGGYDISDYEISE